MPRYEWYLSGLYIEHGVVEADNESDAKHYAEEYARQQFHDALGQADWSFTLTSDDAEVDAP